MTRIAVDLPEDIAKRLETAWRDVSRGALAAVVLEGYRAGALSRDQVGRVLGLSLWDTEAFLKERQALPRMRRGGFRAGPSRSRSHRASMIVVSNTSPLNYLILIDLQHILPTLFERIFSIRRCP